MTNEIRRAKRELLEQLRLNEEIERMWAADQARRRRRREKRRARAQADRYGTLLHKRTWRRRPPRRL